MENIILYGMRGTGKTTIGKKLSISLGKKFIDLDEYIADKIGMPISKYIEQNGWDYFRQIEYEALKEVLENNNDIVLSLGGGTIIFDRNIKLILKNNRKLIYIHTPIELIAERISNDESDGKIRNPLTGKSVLDELKEVYETRKNIYERYYDIIVKNDGNLESVIGNIINEINIGGVCVPITNFDNINFDLINNDRRIKFIELRIDFLNDYDTLEDIIAKIDKKIILTNRIKNEGGNFIGDIVDSSNIIQKYIDKVEYIDIELSNGEKINEIKSKIGNKKLIISYHNFDITPSFEELKNIIDEMKFYSPDIYKIAVMPSDKNDVKTIEDLKDYFKRNFEADFIFISMGELGKDSRIFVPQDGGFLSFGILENNSAPGQIKYEELYSKINKF